MLFLALAIFGSVFTASFIKWCDSRKIDTVGVIASNYLSGSLLGWALVGWDGWPGEPRGGAGESGHRGWGGVRLYRTARYNWKQPAVRRGLAPRSGHGGGRG